MTHKCPINGCRAIVAHSKLMCLTHWQMVPAKLQMAVYKWNRLKPRSQAHFAAMQAATDAVNRIMATPPQYQEQK